MANESSVRNLLNGVEFDDARLYTLLDQLISDFYKLQNQVNPPTAGRVFGTTGVIVTPDTVEEFTVLLYNNNVKLAWVQLDGVVIYELRYLAGNNDYSSWDAASVILRTTTTSADINPLVIPLTFGNHTFLIKAVDDAGNYTPIASVVVINIPIIPAPVISPTVISNFVLLNWTEPDSVFLIDHYTVKKDGVQIGTASGTFESFFETVGGTYTYTVEPVDIVGNVGTPSAGSVVMVNDPQDYILQDSITSILNGTKTNCKLENVGGTDMLLACIDTAETYANHFITNGWATPAAQVAAGYPIYIEPSELTGSYVEIFDFGSILNNLIVVVNWNTVVYGAIETNTSTLETSTDAITWSTPVIATSTFAASLRYVRFTMNFTSVDDLGLAYFYNLQCLLDVHREQDGGTVSVLAADVGGTVVSFNKAFKSVDTIALTPVSTVEQKATYDFAFPVNPTTFNILLFNAAGARVDGTVSWIARGIF